MGIYEEVISSDPEDEINAFQAEQSTTNEWSSCSAIPAEAQSLNAQVREKIDAYNLFLAKNNLEEDLADSSLYSILKSFYNCRTRDSLVSSMQKRKAENMLAFLKEKGKKLSVLSDDDISIPLKRVAQLVECEVHPNATN